MKRDGRFSNGDSFDGTGHSRARRGPRTGSKNPAEGGAESRANQAHRRLKEAIESLSEGFALYDNKDRLVAWNSTFIDIN